jgi:hypothetical protein
MPPRRSARLAAATEGARDALLALPYAILLRILNLLPLDARCSAAGVCRAWRSTLLSERSLWTTLHVRDVRSSVPLPALLRTAVQLAGGCVTSIDVSDWSGHRGGLTAIVTACAASLRELRMLHPSRADPHAWLHPFSAAELLHAAPALTALHADVHFRAPGEEDGGCLRGEPPFGPLRVRHLYVVAGGAQPGVLTALAADCAAHESLAELALGAANLSADGVLDAFVGAAHARRLARLELSSCPLGASTAAALARLLGEGGEALATLVLRSDGPPAMDEAGATTVSDALRANATLTSLTLRGSSLAGDARACAALLRGADGHASLRRLRFCTSAESYVTVTPSPAAAAALGGALGALLAANAPALTQLDVSDCHLGDDALRALLDGLRANTHLRALDMACNEASAAFSRDALLPAVRANGSLRALRVAGHDATPAQVEAEGFVYQRSTGLPLDEATSLARLLNTMPPHFRAGCDD